MKGFAISFWGYGLNVYFVRASTLLKCQDLDFNKRKKGNTKTFSLFSSLRHLGEHDLLSPLGEKGKNDVTPIQWG